MIVLGATLKPQRPETFANNDGVMVEALMTDQGQSKPARTGMSIPGQATEEAIANVGTDAGRSLLRGLEKLGDAALGPWIATREAKAASAKLAIETKGKIEAHQAVVEARRKYETEEAEHLGLLDRRAQRLRVELAREQENLESIQHKALEFTESDPDSTSSQEIDEDWLFQCADFAQRVSDKDVQVLWARVLSSASIKGRSQLSAQALQTLSLFNKCAAIDFQKFVFVVAHLGFFPVIDRQYQSDPQQIDLDALIDLGIIDRNTALSPYRFKDFMMGIGTPNLGLQLFTDRVGLTKRGADIANAVFRGSQFNPGDHLIDDYLQILVQREVRNNKAVSIFLPGDGGQWPSAFVITERGNSAVSADWQSDNRYVSAGPRLKTLLERVGQQYKIDAS
jgi:uncharacterized protein DUF2806